MIRKNWKIVLAGLLLALVALRAALPAYMLTKANEFLAGYSSVFSARIGDIDLSFIRMAYRMERIEVKLRKDNYEVLRVASVDVSLAWRELVRGRILTDIVVRSADIKATPDIFPAFKAIAAENEKKNAQKTSAEKQEDARETETIKSKLFPLRIERIVVADSSLQFAAEKNSPEEKRLVLDQTQIRISNISPLKKETKTVATFESRLMKSAQLKGVGQSRVSKEKMDWDVDAEMRGFNLIQANPFLLDLVPFTFTEGKLDLFAEAKSENGAMVGYVKPFLTKVDVLARKEKFKSTKHFFTEIAAALGNVIAQKPKYKSVATKVDFTKAGPEAEFKIDVLGAVANAVEHRLDKAIAPSVEDEIVLE